MFALPSVAHIWRTGCWCSAEKGGQFAKKEHVNHNPRYLTPDELDDVVRGFQQFNNTRNQGMIDLLYRWTLNVDVLHGLDHDQRTELVDNVEVVTVKPGEDIVHKGAVGTATTFFIVLSGTCSIWLPPLDSAAFVVSTQDNHLTVDTDIRPSDRAAEAKKRWLELTEQTHAEKAQLKVLQKQEQERQREADELAQQFGGEWVRRTAKTVKKQQRKKHHRKKTDGTAEAFSNMQDGPKRVYLLRGICIHNKSHNLHLIVGLNCVYMFTGVGTSLVRATGQRSTR